MCSRYHSHTHDCCKRPYTTVQSARAALQALGDHVSLEAVARVLDTIKFHGSDGIGFPDFVAIMTKDSQDLESGQQRGKADVTTAYNIAIMARAYRQLRPFSCILLTDAHTLCSDLYVVQLACTASFNTPLMYMFDLSAPYCSLQIYQSLLRY